MVEALGISLPSSHGLQTRGNLQAATLGCCCSRTHGQATPPRWSQNAIVQARARHLGANKAIACLLHGYSPDISLLATRLALSYRCACGNRTEPNWSDSMNGNAAI